MTEQQTRDSFVTGPGCWLALRNVRSRSVIHKSCLFLIIGVYGASPPALFKALVLTPVLRPRFGDSVTQVREARLDSQAQAVLASTTSESEVDPLITRWCGHSSARMEMDALGSVCGGDSRGLSLNPVIPQVLHCYAGL